MKFELKDPAFYNGFTHFCAECHSFFSVGTEAPGRKVRHCPHCGSDDLLTNYRQLESYCFSTGTPLATYRSAFPPARAAGGAA
ncbi:MAG: hypothetical protein LBN21_12995 [Treponema sp.]|nr:hypothetical protein [Treponema sp.]